MRMGAVFVIALCVNVCRGFNDDVADTARLFLYGTCGCVEHVSSGQTVATCQVDALRPMPDKYSYLGTNNCVDGYVPVCGRIFTVCYCLCKLDTKTVTTAPPTTAPPSTQRFCEFGSSFYKISSPAGLPCQTDANCFDVCTADEENSKADCFCENKNGLYFHAGEQCNAGQRCNSNGRCLDVCPTGSPACVCPAGVRNTVDCYCENLLQRGDKIFGKSCTAGQQCNSNGNCQGEDCPKEIGFCVLPNGDDQNSGVIKLDNVDGNTIDQQAKCLSRCRAYKEATGCEVIWHQDNRGCYVHTQQVARGNNVDRHECWIFSKCKEVVEYKEQLQHIFLALDTNHDCKLSVSDIVSVFRDMKRKIPLDDAEILLGIKNENLGVHFEQWKQRLLEENSKTKNLVHYWREAFAKVEESFRAGVTRPRDSIITVAAQTAVSTLASGTRISKCHHVELIKVESASVELVEGLKYTLELRLATMTGGDCTDEIVKVCENIVVLKPLPEDCNGIYSSKLINQDKITCNDIPQEEQLSPSPPQTYGSGPAGLQWVSDEEWAKMEGGKAGNPEIIVSSASRDSRRDKLCRIWHNGCWQAGWLNNPTIECYVGRLRWWTKSSNFQRLVNPANSVEYEWRGWDEDKHEDEMLPKGVVYADRDCNWLAVRYHDGDLFGAQVASGKDVSDGDVGEVYYAGYSDWWWDDNEYDLLVELGITNYELLSIEFDDERTDLSKSPKKVFIDTQIITNEDPKHTAKQTAKLSNEIASTETWQHGITWSRELGTSTTATLGGDIWGGSLSATFSFSIGLSQNNDWGGSYSETVLFESSAEIEVPPNHKREVVLHATLEEKDLPYKAKVRITYKNGSKKTVTDVGRIKADIYGKSFIDIKKAVPLS